MALEFEDLQHLVGVRLPRDLTKLNDMLSYIKCEATRAPQEPAEGETSEFSVENKDTNRPDLWSAEGMARALRGFLGIEVGLKRYRVRRDSGVVVKVNRELRSIRPFIACVVARNVRLSYGIIRGLIHLQDKLDQSYGRKRRRSSIGLYDYDLITPPLEYGVSSPEATSFVPLESAEEMTLAQILEKHPKGIEYGHIVKQHGKWPILLDSKGKVLSFPPIINSNDLGRITADTKNVLIEVTGTSHETVLNALTTLAVCLADRGGEIYSSTVLYPYGGTKREKTPTLKNKRIRIDLGYIQRVLGLELGLKEIERLLSKARFAVSRRTKAHFDVEIPCYRMDVMHPVDVIEDIGIAYGLNSMEPRWPAYSTIGGISQEEEFSDLVREIAVGLGFQEVLTFTMTSPEKLFQRMNLEPNDIIEVLNPRIQTMTCLRNWLLPSLIEVLSANTHVEYPQRIFEVGFCTVHDPLNITRARDARKLACASAHAEANFTEAKSYLDPLLLNLAISYEIEETEHPSFIEGRVGKITSKKTDLGTIGEVHPKVLENWKLENPVAVFEIDLDRVMKLALGRSKG